MPDKNDKLVDALKQIKRRQLEVLNQIDDIKQNSDAAILPEIEQIERNAWEAVRKIDELTEKSNRALSDEIERNRVLFVTAAHSYQSPRRQKIGNVWV